MVSSRLFVPFHSKLHFHLPESLQNGRLHQSAPGGAGWAVVCGLGFFFAAFMILLSFIQQRYTNRSIKDTDEFASASRSVKPASCCRHCFSVSDSRSKRPRTPS